METRCIHLQAELGHDVSPSCGRDKGASCTTEAAAEGAAKCGSGPSKTETSFLPPARYLPANTVILLLNVNEIGNL